MITGSVIFGDRCIWAKLWNWHHTTWDRKVPCSFS